MSKVANDGVAGVRFHPSAASYPLLEGSEFDEFVDDVRARGIVSPVTIWRDPETNVDWLLDGRNRYRACARLAAEGHRDSQTGKPVACEVEVYQGPAEEIPALVRSLNERRRHLSPEALLASRTARNARIVVARRAGDSLRTIAVAECVGLATVQRVVDAAAVAPSSGRSNKTGSSGTYPARPRKKKQAPSVTSSVPPALASPAEPAPSVESAPALSPEDGLERAAHAQAFCFDDKERAAWWEAYAKSALPRAYAAGVAACVTWLRTNAYDGVANALEEAFPPCTLPESPGAP